MIRSKVLCGRPCGPLEAEVDVHYDALLANRRTLDDPEMVSVQPGESVLLRLIASASARQNFYVDTGSLAAEILAVDGKAVRPVKGNFFQLGVAQRLDLKVTIPKDGGAFPILAQGEGTKLLCGIVLITQGASAPQLSRTASASTAALDNTQEKRLQAVDPLPERVLSIARFLRRSAETWPNYVWKINGAAYPNRDSLDIRHGERVGLVFTNDTNMAHPMHLHGHDFQVVEIDGEKISGPLRDTLVVPPASKITVAFDADNPGIWALHCHLIYHLVTGMFTVLKYDGADHEVLATGRTGQGVYTIEVASKSSLRSKRLEVNRYGFLRDSNALKASLLSAEDQKRGRALAGIVSDFEHFKESILVNDAEEGRCGIGLLVKNFSQGLARVAFGRESEQNSKARAKVRRRSHN